MTKYLLLFIFIGLTGCLERKEEVKIDKDGSIYAKWKIKGDKQDVVNGLQLPSKSFTVEQKEIVENDKKRFVHKASGKFANIDSYTKALTFSEEDLQIEQNLRIEKNGSKTYYFFSREYQGRDWWKFERLKKQEIDQKLTKRVSKKGIDSLSLEERSKFLNGLANFEVKKRLLIIEDALGQAIIEKQFALSAIDNTLSKLDEKYREIISAQTIELFLSLSKQQQAQKITLSEQKINEYNSQILNENFASYPVSEIQKHIHKAKKLYQLSEDIMDENFKVHLTLPGRIISTNGERIEKNGVFWETNGKSLANRNVMLQAVSVVED
ncbi:hypothetical protein [Candidatus Uabimicrobium sp. HlEnr_7]|uniref:hypothetical protein n=1 Tax=Candidatus Uabimicrobium helgolandensis TaxID=3095367 RepID=UPI0035586F4C